MLTPHRTVIPRNFLGRLYIYNVAIIVTYKVIFHPDLNHPWHYFISCWQGKVRFWPHDELIHHPRQYFCSLIHKKCHPKKYHVDIKYHMTLHITFSVALFWLFKLKSKDSLPSISMLIMIGLDTTWFQHLSTLPFQ